MLLTSELREARAFNTQTLLEAKLSKSDLPAACKDSLRKRFAGKIAESWDLDEAIADEKKSYSALVRGGYLGNRRSAGIQITRDERDKLQEGMDNMLSLDPSKQRRGFSSLRESFRQIAGPIREEDSDLAHRMLFEATVFAPRISDRWQAMRPLSQELRESLKVSDWGEIFNTSMHKALIAAYDHEDYQKWRDLVSNYGNLRNFGEQSRVRYGGYGLLPTVTEQGTYQPLASPGNEAVKYTPSKRGGLEDLTWETMLADDVGAVRDIPRRLGLAAIMTLSGEILDFLRGNPVIYDGHPLFDASEHGNTADSSPLSAPNLKAAIGAMRDQTAFGNSAQLLGGINRPYRLWVPNELEDVAFKLTTSVTDPGAANEAATTPNYILKRYNGLHSIVIDDFTDANDWFATADPKKMPLMEVGFLNGNDEPELFVQNDPNVGSMFSADKITYKIRHVHGKAVLDYRGFFRRRG